MVLSVGFQSAVLRPCELPAGSASGPASSKALRPDTSVIPGTAYPVYSIRTACLMCHGSVCRADVHIPFLPGLSAWNTNDGTGYHHFLVQWLPFAAMQNMPLQIFCGSIMGTVAAKGICFQIFWLTILVLTGRAAMEQATKKVIINGG